MSDKFYDANKKDASQILYEASKKTWVNRKGKIGEVIEEFEEFSGTRYIDVGGLPKDVVMFMNLDGVGTKMEIAERLEMHNTIAFDLFAMVCDDAVCRGGVPTDIGSILDVNNVEKDGKSYLGFVQQLADGYVKAANDAGVAVINGEMAQLGARVSGYGPFNYNWGASVIWFARKDKLFTGKEIQVGDSLVGLKEQGFRSNGLTIVRKVLSKEYGPDWHINQPELAQEVLAPSIIYCKAVSNLYGSITEDPLVEVHGFAHITGGGLPEKIGRALKPTGFGAQIDNPYQPPEIMIECQKMGQVSDRTAYMTWNMGQGGVVITPSPNWAIKLINDYGIEARVIGKVTREPGIRITSKGYEKPGAVLEF